MEAGKLIHRVTIQTPTRDESAVSGRVKETFSDTATVWAQVKPRSASRREIGAQEIGMATHDISMRYTPDLVEGCRLKFGTRIFRLIGPPINVDERNIELRMAVIEDVQPAA